MRNLMKASTALVAVSAHLIAGVSLNVTDKGTDYCSPNGVWELMHTPQRRSGMQPERSHTAS
jgi:hypothetical protein